MPIKILLLFGAAFFLIGLLLGYILFHRKVPSIDPQVQMELDSLRIVAVQAKASADSLDSLIKTLPDVEPAPPETFIIHKPLPETQEALQAAIDSLDWYRGHYPLLFHKASLLEQEVEKLRQVIQIQEDETSLLKREMETYRQAWVSEKFKHKQMKLMGLGIAALVVLVSKL